MSAAALVAGAIIVAALFGIAAIAAALVWRRPTSTATRPASSSRKAGRTRADS